ncbi:oxygen-independent coproporphyrinogen III oxidase [Psychroflexus sp. ALD_RP9]|uniref:oxygen-independent coproporphyrinogen III oxidase n=1 Tax=Psychroflexus sp. ALD_RP9 TaxID=2777186 RepID=UPI001A8D6358|nr:oxygen-independent coproporphyrinogen III oxidase [Psychroflexus sp. ALD_RP9]QSS97438.1 oxygen-independent coproporphyrinogen III oxidase [Psychroflexus sp. ALD_RP9]
MQNLIAKYNVPGPRYTSYPTVPFWEDVDFSTQKWVSSLQQQDSNALSLYIHLPFCESLCTFCACNKRITKRHDVEIPYIEAVLKEWQMYLEVLDDTPVIKEIHLGGGTPTFFSAENLENLIKSILNTVEMTDEIEFSFEGHPNNTTKAHLETLYDLGFSRVSYGIQDYNPKVQIAIHRIQSFEAVENATKLAREIGYKSVGHDIIFGLPMQSLEDVINTIEKTKLLMPDRIAFYSYAHVPWTKGNGQRGFNESDLPSPELKRQQYETGKKMLEEIGYIEIGMDHFALPKDDLSKAYQTNNLHRNFMGYTTTQTQKMIGLGVSAISDSWFAFAQNEKKLDDYYKKINRNELPIFRGHLLNNEDLIIRKQILNLMCNFETKWNKKEEAIIDFNSIINSLSEFEVDQLIKVHQNSVEVSQKGKAFIRNICMAFDLRLKKAQPNQQLFSMTI